jgi:predicted nucleic acid-binding protein
MRARPLVVADATPLIALAKIGQLDLLPGFFGNVLVPGAVYGEIVLAGAGRIGAAEIQTANWIHVEAIADRSKVDYLLTQLDIGEAEAIVLAQEKQADWLLVDENKARSIAQRLGLQMIGTVGLLLLAKEQGKLPAVRPQLDALRSHQFRLSQKVYESVIRQANE